MPDARSHVRRHLDALKAAGVEFLPAAPPTPPAAAGFTPGGSAAGPADAGPDSPAARRVALDTLAAEVEACARCPELYATRSRTVFGVGPAAPDLCFVGEAPGADEDRVGEPFVGAAGQLLNKIIAAMGLRREDVYICNTLKCRPPMNATPTDTQRANCRPFFDRQLDLVRPKFICCLGATAAKNVLNTSLGITRLRGTWHDYHGVPVLCTFHPSYLLRDPTKKKDVWADMKVLLKRMGYPVPGASS